MSGTTVLLCWVFSAGLLAQGPPASPDSGTFKISTDVDRVLLPVTVKDHKGELVSGLTQDNFRIYEDGQPRQIRWFSARDIPVTVGLVMDNSSSMRGKKRDTIVAALNFMRHSNPQDEIFVVNFNEKVSMGLPPGTAFSSDLEPLVAALNMQPPDGKTALYDAIVTGIGHLAQGTRDKKALLVVSDGGDNSSGHKLDDVLALARKSDAIIYTIGIFDPQDPEKNTGVLKKLARLTGGEMYLPQRLPDIHEICEHIARDLRNQYTLGFAPAGAAQAGRYHRIQVTVTAPNGHKLVARTRPGFYDPGQSTAQGGRPAR